LTIRLRSGINYSPPLQHREVRSGDIKYAMERCFLPQVGNGYSSVYWGGIKGVTAYVKGTSKEVAGIQALNPRTLVLQLSEPVGVIANANALALPCTVPVPKDYAQKYDRPATSKYGEHQVFTGPYMIQGAGHGTVGSAGYAPGRKLVLVRNPSWDRSSDFRPAYFDKIIVRGGNDPTVASRSVLSGSHMMSGDLSAPPTAVLKSALSSRKDQLKLVPSQGNRYITLNTKVKPLDDGNFRKAIAAATDRDALRLTRGGAAIGTLATHFIPPGVPGFAEAGGRAGPGYDFYRNPKGDLALAKQYMKKAGYSSGMYTGRRLLMVGDDQPPESYTGEAFQSQLAKIGVRVNYRRVPHATMQSKFCSVPTAAVAICPNLGWAKDFFDAQSMLDPVFNGKNIVPSGNVNMAQANDPAINALLDRAVSITDSSQRAEIYGRLDRQITGQVFVITWLWDNQVDFASKDVRGVASKFNASWDLTFSSLK
jgi:peptide/nickel transport system substrate-binding protein